MTRCSFFPPIHPVTIPNERLLPLLQNRWAAAGWGLRWGAATTFIFLDTATPQLYDAFGPEWFAFLSSTNELNNLTSLILRFGIWLISYHISFQKSREIKGKSRGNLEKTMKKVSQNQAKNQPKCVESSQLKNKGKSGHFGKTSIGSFSELKKYF